MASGMTFNPKLCSPIIGRVQNVVFDCIRFLHYFSVLRVEIRLGGHEVRGESLKQVHGWRRP